MKTTLEVVDDQGVEFEIQAGFRSDDERRHHHAVVMVDITWLRDCSHKKVALTIPEARELARQLLAGAGTVEGSSKGPT